MRDKLRKRYQVQKEVTQSGRFEGEIELSELKRLAELLHCEDTDQQGRKIALSFEFTRNEFDIPVLAGHLQTSIQLECQRCLQPLELPMELDFSLLIDASDEMVRHSSQDTLYSEDGYIDIAEVVEDELILAIPLVAMHENTACNSNWQASASAAETAKSENPFAVLKQLKTTD
jgi:uncharacterized protein